MFQFVLGMVWLINGLYCKIGNGVPRHEAIVRRITRSVHARALTVGIGFGEVLIALAVFAGWQKLWVGWLQISLIAVMNLLEIWLAPDLLLWGRWNAVFALLLICAIYTNLYPPKLSL